MTLFPSPQRPDWLWDPPSILFSGYPEIKQTEREADHSPTSSPEVKCSCTSICLHDIYRDRFKFTMKWTCVQNQVSRHLFICEVMTLMLSVGIVLGDTHALLHSSRFVIKMTHFVCLLK